MGVGIVVASLVAFAATVWMPDPEATATEDRLSAMASRRRGKNGESDPESLMLARGDEESLNALLNKVLESVPPWATISIRPTSRCHRQSSR